MNSDNTTPVPLLNTQIYNKCHLLGDLLIKKSLCIAHPKK